MFSKQRINYAFTNPNLQVKPVYLESGKLAFIEMNTRKEKKHNPFLEDALKNSD